MKIANFMVEVFLYKHFNMVLLYCFYMNCMLWSLLLSVRLSNQAFIILHLTTLMWMISGSLSSWSQGSCEIMHWSWR